MSQDSRNFLNSLINKYSDPSSVLWQILRALGTGVIKLDKANETLANTTWYNNKIYCKTPTVANDIADFRFIVNLPVDNNGNFVYKQVYISQIILDSKAIPSSNAVFILSYSRDNGVTWVDIFSGISFVLPTGVQNISYGNMTTKTFFPGDIFRLDCTTVGGSSGVEIEMLGVLQ